MITKLSLLICFALLGKGFAGTTPLRWQSPLRQLNPKLHPGKGPSTLGETRIVGGVEATPHAWPHMAALVIDDMFFCGGSLISDQWVLTAAHCLDGSGHAYVTVGAHDINADEASKVVVTSTEFHIHDGWHDNNDIALIKLPEPLEFTDEIQAIKLPSVDIPDGTVATTMGWGSTSGKLASASRGSRRNPLMQVDVPILSLDFCEAVYGPLGPGILCTDTSGGHGSCGGDSGGPLVHDGMIYGITNFGAAIGCQAGFPDGYARVYFYLNWIESITGITP